MPAADAPPGEVAQPGNRASNSMAKNQLGENLFIFISFLGNCLLNLFSAFWRGLVVGLIFGRFPKRDYIGGRPCTARLSLISARPSSAGGIFWAGGGGAACGWLACAGAACAWGATGTLGATGVFPEG